MSRVRAGGVTGGPREDLGARVGQPALTCPAHSLSPPPAGELVPANSTEGFYEDSTGRQDGGVQAWGHPIYPLQPLQLPLPPMAALIALDLMPLSHLP